MQPHQIRKLVLASVMAALTAAGSYIYIPVGAVPIVLANLFVLLSGLLLGSRWAAASMALYLLVGTLGLPVFAGGQGGIAHVIGPTGGYLFGFVLAAWIVGCIHERKPNSRLVTIIALLLGSLSIYVLGLTWLKFSTHMDWIKAIMIGMVPFLPGDVIKAVAALFIAQALEPMVAPQHQCCSQ